MDKNNPYYFEIGEKVYIIDDSSDGQSPQIKQCIVFAHEWWNANSDYPVYYDLKDAASGKRVTTCGSITHHFSTLFRDLRKAQKQLHHNMNDFLENRRYYY